MSRSGYSDDCDDYLAHGRWRAQVISSIRGKRGQSFLQELVIALESMPNKRLISHELRKDGEVCALGALGVKRGMELEKLDPEEYEHVAEEFEITEQIIREITFENDEGGFSESPEERWTRMHRWAKGYIKS